MRPKMSIRLLRSCSRWRVRAGAVSWLYDQSYVRVGILAISFYKCSTIVMSREWGFLTNHGRVLLCIAHDPGVRLRDIAAELGITERTAYGIVTDLTDAGYVVKKKDGRRNQYEVQGHLPVRDAITRERTIGEVLDALIEPAKGRAKRRAATGPARRPPGSR
jgi:DNA-binding transcriptional ArsR family regulator